LFFSRTSPITPLVEDFIKTVLLGVIEGITEFLPVSSTGHLKLAEVYMGKLVSEEFASNFDIFIQIGAIFAVVVFFRQKLLYLVGLAPHDGSPLPTPPPENSPHQPLTPTDPRTDPLPYQVVTQTTGPGGGGDRLRVILLLVIATLPLAIGYFLAKKSEALLESHPSWEAPAIAAALGIGGVLMILIERLKPAVSITSMSAMSYLQALLIGGCQILAAVFPGTSRSASTIMPALCLGISRPVAAEFSFFLAIPAMFGAAGIKLLHFLRHGHHSSHEFTLLLLGTFVSFVVAYVVIAAFMGFIRKYSFTPFGIYRILAAIAVLLLLR
jgi:undecaprenyl-diphosphatase